jgi:FtsH-binding integral membrane protein
MSELILQQSINLNIIFLIVGIIGYTTNNDIGKYILGVALVFLCIFIPIASIITRTKTK